MVKRKLVERPYGGGTLTKAAFFGKIRSAIRRIEWKPKREFRKNAIILTPILDEAGEQKLFLSGKKKGQLRTIQMFKCEGCKGIFKGSKVQVDHITPCGSLNDWEDVVPFIQKCLCEDGFQILCLDCHQEKTNKERKLNKTKQ